MTNPTIEDADAWVLAAAKEAVKEIQCRSEHVAIDNTNESVFRYFFMLHAAKECPNAKLHSEWGQRYDLAVETSGQWCVIEFKYNLSRPKYDPSGTHRGYKGGPSLQNEREFEKCVEKLRKTTIPGIAHRFLVLVYRQESMRGKHSFERSYSDCSRWQGIEKVWASSDSQFETRVFKVKPETPI